VPPPLAGAAPDNALVNVLTNPVNCVCVSAIGVAGLPVTFPMTLLAAKFAIFASVTAAAAIEFAFDAPVTSPDKVGVSTPDGTSIRIVPLPLSVIVVVDVLTMDLNCKFGPEVVENKPMPLPRFVAPEIAAVNDNQPVPVM
jgi:hypothetical protein